MAAESADEAIYAAITVYIGLRYEVQSNGISKIRPLFFEYLSLLTGLKFR